MTAAMAPLRLFLIAGEPSGDLLGARLMAAIRRMADRPVRFLGIGGERMVAEGLEPIFPMAELALFGVVELVPRLPRLIWRLHQTVAAIRDGMPDAVITIDAPGFTFRVGRRLRRSRHPARAVPLIHYVAPTVWAWRPERARKIAAFLDHLLVLLPFEPPWFEREGLATTYVGHPIVEGGADRGDAAGFRRRHGIAADARLIAVLPGSRTTELRRLLPDFGGAVERLAARTPGLIAVVPTLSHVAETVRAAVAGWSVPTLVTEGDAEKYDAFAAAEVALAASGTVALELALARLPAVIAYRMNPLTVALYRRLVRTKYANLVNIMLDRPLVPEMIQEDCRPDRLAAAVAALLDDPAARQAQIDGLAAVGEWLGAGGTLPSDRAAETVWRLAVRGSRDGGS
jgi:lipid-A-disaccharide synthase